MKIHRSMQFFLFILPLVLFAGCGSDNGQATATLAASQQCIGCHASNSVSISPVTGARITDEWQRSAHNSANGARCPDCHTTFHFHADFLDCLACHSSHTHSNSCSQCHGGSPQTSCRNCHDVTGQKANPDDTGTCSTCHNALTLGSPHFSTNITGTTHDAQFVDQQNSGKCRNCHNPHDTTILQEARDWATSGHGDVKAQPWTAEDFKSNTSCLRCHTATGYINYVTGTPAFTLPTVPLAASPTYGVLGCNTCHASYAFKQSVRTVAQYTAPYNGGLSPRTFPDAGTSNLCIPCHAGRESEDTIKAVTDFTKASFKNSHYMAAAGMMYMTTGFKSFTTATAPASATYTYGDSYTMFYGPGTAPAGYISSTHRKLGTPLITGDSHNPAAFTPGNFDSGGPCVTCHLNAAGQPNRGTSHTLAINLNTANQLCSKCHSTEVDSQAHLDTFLKEQSEVFQDAVTLAVTILQARYSIKYDPANHPYFYDLAKDPTGTTPVTDWTRGTKNQKFGQRMMGACYNINLLNRDPATFAHARTYTRRLIYDTIDFLDDGTINMSTGASAVKYFPSVYVKGATANDPVTTGAYTYLAGYNRNTGAWNAVERP